MHFKLLFAAGGVNVKKSLRSANLKSEYSSSGASLIEDFFSPALEASQTYDRAAGYFSSSLFVLAPVAWTDFFLDGGKMRLLCSAELSPADRKIVLQHRSPFSTQQTFEETWEQLLVTEDGQLTSSLLRALLFFGKLELKVATFRSRAGLFHDKLGVFKDEVDGAVSFTGSANETWNAWSGYGNHESIDVFRTWDSKDEQRVAGHQVRFEEYWGGLRPDLEVHGGEALREVILDREPDEDLEEILQRVRKELRKALGRSGMPKSPPTSRRELRPYQKDALSNWEANDYRGIISFATGGGKTLSALEAIRRWAALGGSSLVLVPTSILLSQWMQEIKRELPDALVLRADSKARIAWRKHINAFLAGSSEGQPKVVLTTYKTASSAAFASLAPGSHRLLVVGDEVHRFGAPDTKKIAGTLTAGATLGLSATPLRSFDDEGTEAIFNYFGPSLQPVYSLREAIVDGNLVPYEFNYQVARLNADEQEQWDELTAKIVRASGSSEYSSETPSAYLRNLLIARARIAKTAASKVALVGEMLATEFEAGDRWLVYCETEAHLEEVRASIRNLSPQLTLMSYTASNEDEHDRVLAHFKASGGVLLAIRCLDEGVDIPLINKAIIVSSSQSPREFIQRRGRVLRKATGKPLAKLYDFLMEDFSGGVLSVAELDRLIEFSADALNRGPFVTLTHRREIGGK